MTPISNSSHVHRHVPLSSPPASMPDARPGKSAGSVGHIAKEAVSLARAAGVEVPNNAQGLAASWIAAGADPASVFAARVADIPEASPETTDAGDGVPPAPDLDTAVPQDGGLVSTLLDIAPPRDDLAIALDLLS